MALVLVAQFLARFDPKYVTDLVARSGESPEEIEEQTESRVALALEDAEAELEGYRPRIAVERWPGNATRTMHIIKVATYLLTLDRPGKEYDQIRNAYSDTIEFYKGLLPVDTSSATTPLGVSHSAPAERFSDERFKGFGDV